MYGKELALTQADIAKGLEVEASMVERLKSGDKTAFDELFHCYKEMVFRLAFRFLGDRDEALDLSQEVFLTVYREVRTFRGEASLKTWIYRIVITRAANYRRWWRRRKRDFIISLDTFREREGKEGAPVQKLASAERTPYEIVYGLEVEEKVHQALQALPMNQRVALIMRDIEGLSYQEIAEVTKTSLGTVKSRIARGREELIKKLRGFLK